MTRFRILGAALATALLIGSAAVVPANAQGQGGPSRNCTQQSVGGGGAGGTQQGGRQQSDARLAGVIAAAIQNVSVGANALNSSLNGVNLQLVCLNDVLNANDIRLLTDILNNSPILTNSLNDVTILQNFLNNSNVLNNVQLVGVNVQTGEVFVLSR